MSVPGHLLNIHIATRPGRKELPIILFGKGECPHNVRKLLPVEGDMGKHGGREGLWRVEAGPLEGAVGGGGMSVSADRQVTTVVIKL